MNESQRLFLVQARADHRVFRVFRADTSLPACHALHYLQMATELLGKAQAWKHGPAVTSHKAFVSFLRGLVTNRAAQSRLGYNRRNDHWAQTLRGGVLFAEAIERLAPSLAGDGPNPEYPWPPDDPHHAPVEFAYPLWAELQTTAAGRKFLTLIEKLFDAAESFL